MLMKDTNEKVIKIYTKIRELTYISYAYDYSYAKVNPFAKHFFAKIIETILLIYTPPDMFITERPSNVINNIPFNIKLQNKLNEYILVYITHLSQLKVNKLNIIHDQMLHYYHLIIFLIFQ